MKVTTVICPTDDQILAAMKEIDAQSAQELRKNFVDQALKLDAIKGLARATAVLCMVDPQMALESLVETVLLLGLTLGRQQVMDEYVDKMKVGL